MTGAAAATESSHLLSRAPPLPIATAVPTSSSASSASSFADVSASSHSSTFSSSSAPVTAAAITTASPASASLFAASLHAFAPTRILARLEDADAASSDEEEGGVYTKGFRRVGSAAAVEEDTVDDDAFTGERERWLVLLLFVGVQASIAATAAEIIVGDELQVSHHRPRTSVAATFICANRC